MLTVFSLPKPFIGHIGVIQRNAVSSWVKLGQGCEIILFGDEEGTGAVAKEFGVRHHAEVARNEYGTPLLNYVFSKATAIATGEILCYVNADIILGADFLRAVEKVRTWTDRFLMVGECWDAKIESILRFNSPEGDAQISDLVKNSGESRGPWYIDYFVFTRGLYESIPAFAVGRAGFDNWLVWKARSTGARVVDVTADVKAIHQNHDYSHVPGGRVWSYKGDEARRNVDIAGGQKRLYLISDASHKLRGGVLRKNFGAYLRIQLRWHSAMNTMVDATYSLGWRLVELTRPIRHRFGLRKGCITRLKTRFVRSTRSGA